MTGDEVIIMCGLVDDVRPTSMGSHRRACSECGVAVWVAPSSYTVAPIIRVVCVPCGLTLVANDPDPRWVDPT